MAPSQATNANPTRKPPRLSKSRLLSGHQCPLRLWYDCFDRGAASEIDPVQQLRFDRGTEIGELARERFAGGRLITASPTEPDLALEQTAAAMADSRVPVLYEAAFRHRGVLVRVDILRRSDAGSWALIEVKSGTREKEVSVRDVAVQLWVARGTGLSVSRAALLLLNRDYVFDGRQLDLRRLFRLADVSTTAAAMAPEIGRLASSLAQMLAAGEAPEIEPGPQCSDPYECGYLAHCTAGAPEIAHPIEDLPRLSGRRRLELEELGIQQITDVPDGFKLTPLQRRVHACVTEGRDWASEGLANALGRITYPVSNLDFEAFMPAIPLYAGCRPYDALPFQYSIHVEASASDPSGDLEHREYLYEGASDPRRALAEALIADLGDRGSICVYSRYESQVIEALAAWLPDLAPRLRALLPRLRDLLPIVRAHYYHPDFRGSFSIKSVLPVLAPGMSYSDLEIDDGMLAATLYERSLAMEDEEAKRQIFEDLRAYCAQDTLAMVEVRRALLRRAGVLPPVR